MYFHCISDCEMSIIIPNDHIEIGEDACVEFTTRNNSVNEAKAKLTIVVEVITYGGKVVSQVKTDRKNLFIGANTGKRCLKICYVTKCSTCPFHVIPY